MKGPSTPVEANPPTVRANEKSAVHPKLVGASLAGVLAALMITLLLSALDQTIVGTALPTIVADLNGVNNYTWVITAYLLTSTTVIISGRMASVMSCPEK